MLNCCYTDFTRHLMKNYLYGLLFLFSSQLLASAPIITEKQTDKQQNQQQTILVFGDSLSAAYNIKREQGWVSLLQDLLIQNKHSIVIANASISGETTSGGLERLEKQLKLHKPQIVILELGGNDGLRGFDLNVTRDNLTRMVEMSIKHSSKVLLAGIAIPPNYGRTYTKRFSEIYTTLALKPEVELIPFILDKVATQSEYMQPDGIHPNASGQPLVLETVWQYLEPLLTK
jgi:acyl-CoA thioesterase I